MSLIEILDQLNDLVKRVEELEDTQGSIDEDYLIGRISDAVMDNAYEAGSEAGSNAGYEAAENYCDDRFYEIEKKMERLEEGGTPTTPDGIKLNRFHGVLTDEDGKCHCYDCQAARVNQVVAKAFYKFFDNFYLDADGYTIREQDGDKEVGSSTEILEGIIE